MENYNDMSFISKQNYSEFKTRDPLGFYTYVCCIVLCCVALYCIYCIV